MQINKHIQNMGFAVADRPTGPTVQPPHFFRKWRGQQTQFGKLLPDRTIHAVFAADNFHPRVKIIIVGYETLYHVTQQRLFLGKTEIHDYSPVPKV